MGLLQSTLGTSAIYIVDYRRLRIGVRKIATPVAWLLYIAACTLAGIQSALLRDSSLSEGETMRGLFNTPQNEDCM